MRKTFAVFFKHRNKMVFLVFIKGFFEYAGYLKSTNYLLAENELKKILKKKYKNYDFEIILDMEGEYLELYEKFLK